MSPKDVADTVNSFATAIISTITALGLIMWIFSKAIKTEVPEAVKAVGRMKIRAGLFILFSIALFVSFGFTIYFIQCGDGFSAISSSLYTILAALVCLALGFSPITKFDLIFICCLVVHFMTVINAHQAHINYESAKNNSEIRGDIVEILHREIRFNDRLMKIEADTQQKK